MLSLELRPGRIDFGEDVLAMSTVVLSVNMVVSSSRNGIFNLIFRLQSGTGSKMRQPERGQRENPFQVTATLAGGKEEVLLDF